eukprot:Plantae.Rhodophyta-Purpureofilum_apyrenoidigerum.ctg27012.p1 GENE.Plantae.Rhodophyta-Purpureofilum_apyrenoidigerum.ctg27012~~Plantae.Rhodophyta-Purpureofilum_apyrenoidigerum.ctg27012.p1  ORF type:complete len:242 (-),score=46.66 Plantae.Rhodophyta-Purpureofilum_apyrenoidigerum.ctg27012:240-965(-)
MAVNIPLMNPQFREFGSGKVPVPYQNETFILRADDINFELKDGTGKLIPDATGCLHVTNVRMVFVVSDKHRSKCRVESAEMPFRGIENAALHQPIFGANNLAAELIPYEDQPFRGTITFKIFFKKGGLGTFLPRFNDVLSTTRRMVIETERNQRQEARERGQAPANTEHAVQDMAWGTSFGPNSGNMVTEQAQSIWYGAPYDENQFLGMVDPSDPSIIYVHQPEQPQTAEPPPSQFVKKNQ